MDKTENRNKPTAVRARHFTHLGFCFYVYSVFNAVNDSSVGMIFRLLPIPTDHYWVVWFRFIYENKTVKDQLVPLICLVSPALTFA
jgi:hypothetical protein